MSEVYDRPFKIGVAFVIAVWLVMTVLSGFISYNRFARSAINFSHSDQYRAGFPLEMWGNRYGLDYGPLVINVLAVTVLSILFGFIFKFLAGKLVR